MKRNFIARFLGRVPYAKAHALQEDLVRKRIANEVGDTILLLEHPPVITLGRGASRELNTKRELWVEPLGVMPYTEALDFQRQVAKARISGTIPEDVLLLVEHPPVVTMGRSAKENHLLATPALLAARGVELFEVERGGDVTFHGPGQLVGYPIFDLKPDRCDVRRYVRDLCEVMIRLAADFDIEAGQISDDPKKLGVWVDLDSPKKFSGGLPRVVQETVAHARFGKIGAVGVRLSRWVTMHGIAFNASIDLRGFGLIVPCGVRDQGVSSLASLGVDPPSLETLARKAAGHFESVFEADATWEEVVSPV